MTQQSNPNQNLSRALTIWLSSLAAALVGLAAWGLLALILDLSWNYTADWLTIILAAVLIPAALLGWAWFYVRASMWGLKRFELGVPSFWNVALALILGHVVAQAIASVPVLISTRQAALGMASVFQMVLFLAFAAWALGRPVKDDLARVVSLVVAAIALVSLTLVLILAVGTAGFVWQLSSPDRAQAKSWVQTAVAEQTGRLDQGGWDSVAEAANGYTFGRPQIQTKTLPDRFIYVVAEDQNGNRLDPPCRAGIIRGKTDNAPSSQPLLGEGQGSTGAAYSVRYSQGCQGD